MHRSVLALVALALAGSACGEVRPGDPASAPSASFPPAAPSSAPALTGELDGFPLALGYDDRNHDDGSPVQVSGRPANRAFSVCDTPVWDPHAGTTDVLGVEWRAEAEWARGRTLVLHPSVGAAEAALTAVRHALTDCAEEPSGQGYGTTHTLLDVTAGEQSVVWADTYWSTSGGHRLHDTGLTVFHLVRVGRAVLLAYEYGEGNGSAQSRSDAVARATALERPVVAAMGELGQPAASR